MVTVRVAWRALVVGALVGPVGALGACGGGQDGSPVGSGGASVSASASALEAVGGYWIEATGPAFEVDGASPVLINESGLVAGTPARDSYAFVWDPPGRVVHLDRLEGHDSLEVSAINDRGQLVGWSRDFSGGFEEVLAQRAVLWGADGSVRDLGVLPGEGDARAMAVNNRGQVVGLSGRRAVLWDTDGTVSELDPLPGAGDGGTWPLAINDRGEVIGDSGDRAVLWGADRSVRDLSDLAGVEGATPVAINDRGQVLLNSWNADDSQSAILWDPDTGAQDLGRLEGADVEPVALNDAGQVVGLLAGADEWRTFLWDPAGGMRELDVGGTRSRPVDINEKGQVVGWRVTGDNPSDEDPEFIGSAFLWDPDLGLIDLGALCDGPSGAYALNERGDVVGWQDEAPDQYWPDDAQHQQVVVWSPTS